MLLAFATFVGLGGDDIPKTIFSICLGLVFAAVGFDEISGEPRLIFFDIPGFLHGINFLVLAIGVYGIGEMLWTHRHHPRQDHLDRGEDERPRASSPMRKEAFRRGWKGIVDRLVAGLLRRHPAGRRRHPGLADGLWRGQDDLERPRELRQGQSQRRRRPGIGQQLGLDRLDAADA